MKKGNIEDLKFDKKNFNQHSEFGTHLLNKSIEETGFGRSIVVDKNNVIIAGNGVTEAAAAKGLGDILVVETTGKELVVVKRMDIDTNSPMFYKMAIADNLVAQKNIVLDVEAIAVVAQSVPSLQEWSTFAQPPETKENTLNKTDDLAAGFVETKFVLTGEQHARLEKALKLSNKKFKANFGTTGNPNKHSNQLHFIIEEFLKTATK